MENKIDKKENYFWGIIGGLIGGLLIAIPLTIAYVQMEKIFLLTLAIVIPFIEFYGYKLLKGKINKKNPIILLILTIIVVSIMAFFILPIGLLVKSNLPVNLMAIKGLYISKNIFTSMLQDYLFSLIFAIFGTYLIGIIINQKILLKVSNINLFSSDNKEKQELKEKAISALKPTFKKYSATQKDKVISKEEILGNFKENKFTDYFNYLKQLNIIKKQKGKYYYSEEDEKNIKINYPIVKIVTAICIVILLTATILFVFGSIINGKVKKVYNKDVSFNIDNTWSLLENYTEDTGWIYYKYLNTEQENYENSYPETIGIIYDKKSSQSYESIEELKTVLELYISGELNYNDYIMNLLTTSNGYDALKLVMNYETNVEIDYYIYKDGKMAYVTAISYSTNDEDRLQELDEYAKNIVDSFKWNK